MCICFVYSLSSDSEYQQDNAMAKGDKLAGIAPGVSPSQEAVLGPAFLGQGISGGEFWEYHG